MSQEEERDEAGVQHVDEALADREPVWLGGAPLDARVAELTRAGLSEVDALLQLLEWAIRTRPQQDVDLLRHAVAAHQPDMAPDVVTDLRWLLGFAELRAGRYALALAMLAPLSQFDKLVDRTLGPQERGPQLLASVLVAQVFRELGARGPAGDEAGKAVEWLGDLGATDYSSCSVTAGQLWKGAHLLGFELEAGLAADAVTDDDLPRAHRHAVAARRWLPRRALDTTSQDSSGSGTVPWRHRVTLLLLWSTLSLARRRSTAALHSAGLALEIAQRHQALPDLARAWYQHGLALLGAPFDPTRYLLDPGSRRPLPGPARFSRPLGVAAAMAESAGMAELASSAHLTLGALYAPHNRTLAILHIDRSMQLADQIRRELIPEFAPWWELSRMGKIRLAHIITHDVGTDHELWAPVTDPATTPPDAEPAVPADRDENEETQPMDGLDDIPPTPDLEKELRTALRQAGYALADETGAGAVITPAEDQDGLLVSWQSSPELGQAEASLSAGLIMKGFLQILENLGFLVLPYESAPDRLIIKGTYEPMSLADDEDNGDRAGRWFRNELEARHMQLRWLADTKVYDVAAMRHGVAGHPLRDLVARILVALDDSGLPLQADCPIDGFESNVGVTVYPHKTQDSYIIVSWETGRGHNSEYQHEVFREASRTFLERVLNAAGIVTSGHVTDGTVCVFAHDQELGWEEPSQPEPSFDPAG